jgi:hypothetical protein
MRFISTLYVNYLTYISEVKADLLDFDFVVPEFF